MEEGPKYRIERKEEKQRGQIQIVLSAVEIGDKGFKQIVEKEEKTGQVTHLNLFRCQLTSISIINMRSANWSSLQQINLYWNRIRDKGCKYIPRVHLPALEEIYLNLNQLSSIGISHLSKADWKRLKKIQLNVNKIGFDSIQTITKSNWMQNCNRNENSSLEIGLGQNKLFVDQVYRMTLHSFPKELTLYAWGNKIEECQKAKLISTLKQKKINSWLWQDLNCRW